VTPFDPNFHFLRQGTWQSICVPNFEFLASSVAEIWRGSQNSPKWSRDPLATPFDLSLHFIDEAPCIQSVFQISCEYLNRWPIYGYFTTSRIWLWNAYSGQFWGVFGDFDPLKLRNCCLDPQRYALPAETRHLRYCALKSVQWSLL